MRLKVFSVLLAVVALPFVFEATTGCGFHPAEDVSTNSYVCACDCEPGEHDRDVRVSAALDDAEQGGVADPDGASDLDLGVTLAGVRFAGLGIPPGAAIVSATIQFTADQAFGGSNSVASNLEMYAVAADDVPAFSGNLANLGSVNRTAASVAWQPPPWSLNESGPAELTPNLRTVIQEIVNRPGWQSGNALALIVAGLGRREAVAFDQNPAHAALLSVAYLDPVSPARFDLQVCVPPADNPDLNGGVEPTAAQLQNDCTGRVQPTLSDLDAACNYPPVCACNVVANTARHAYQCNTSCTPTPVDQQCTNFDPNNGHVEANAAGMDPPVCTVFSPLAADLFGQRTSCAVDGTGHITVSSGSDTDSEVSHATGVVQFVGKPCLGQPNCAVGMTYSLDFADVKVGNFFESATFNKLAGLGESAAGNPAPLSPAGDGTFAPQALGASAQGRRDTNHLQGLATTNDDPVQVTVGWGQSQPTCSLHGTLIGSGDPELKKCSDGPDDGRVCLADSDCTPDPACPNGVCSCVSVGTGDLAMSLDVDTGTIFNQPPTANAGPDQNVECSAAAVTNLVLNASGSSDPDGNIAFYTWLRGNRVGAEVGSDAIAPIQQGLGSQAYVLRVIDALGQADEDTTQVNVVDTTPPVLTCAVSRPALNPPKHDLVNVGLMASAVDQCEGVLPVTVQVFGDEDDDDSTGDGRFSPDAADLDVGSLRLRAERKGDADGRVYLIVTEATDSSGNRGFNCCTVTVPHSNSPAAQMSVLSQAAAARAFCLTNDGTPPAGYFVIGDGPVVGPKQ